VRISDDDDCRAILELYAREEDMIELYVEKDTMILENLKVMNNSHVCSIWTLN